MVVNTGIQHGLLMRARVVLMGCGGAKRGVRGCEGPKDAWTRALMGTPRSRTSLGSHTYLSIGKGPVNCLHYWTHLCFAPDNMTALLHGRRTVRLLLEKRAWVWGETSFAFHMRGHALQSLKGERR